MRILIFRTGQLGDALVGVPSFRVIAGKASEVMPVLLFDRHLGKSYVVSKALLEGSGLVDDLIDYPVGYTRREKLSALWYLLKLLFRLRRERFDCVIHLEPEMKTRPRLLRDKLFFRLAGIKKQITTLQYRRPRPEGRPLQAIEHETDFFLRALGAQGFQVPPPGQGDIDLGLGDAETKEVQEWLGAEGRGQRAEGREQRAEDRGQRAEGGGQRAEGGGQGIGSGSLPAGQSEAKSDLCSLLSGVSRRLPPSAVGVGVGSKMQSKRWPLERFRTVLQRLIESHDILPVFFGGPEDAEAAEQLIQELGRGLNACGRLSLRGSARALQDCRFYLGNDTGTMHLAVAAGIKCVAIFSARDVPGKWYPYGEGHKVHRVPVDCEGCLLYECYEEGRRCLMEIQPEAVYASCLEIIGEGR